jgi:hypothetical protein
MRIVLDAESLSQVGDFLAFGQPARGGIQSSDAKHRMIEFSAMQWRAPIGASPKAVVAGKPFEFKVPR